MWPPSRWLVPAAMLVKLPAQESTLRNWSGRSQATVKAQIPPEDMPAMARLSGSERSLTVLPTSGSTSSIRKRA